MGYSARDRDLAIRTALGEAADQGDVGQAAVLHTIMNRVKSGSFGKSVSDVVLAPNQFEPWQTRAKELNAISPSSGSYKKAGQIFDQVASGEIEDPTGGATHFLQPEIVKQRTGGKLPNWAKGEGVQVGAHTFYKPDEQKMAKQKPADNDEVDYIDLIRKQTERKERYEKEQEEKKLSPNLQPTVPVKKQIQNQPAIPEGAASDGVDYIDLFMKAEERKEALEKEQEAAAQSARFQNTGSNYPVPVANMSPQDQQAFAEQQAAQKLENEKSTLQKFREAISPGNITDPTTKIGSIATSVWPTIKEHAVNSWNGFGQALSNPNLGPTFEDLRLPQTNPWTGETRPVFTPHMKDAGKLLQLTGNALGMVAAPVTGPLSIAEQELGNITGNRDFARKAITILPLGRGVKALHETSAGVKGLRSIEQLLPEDIEATLKRNPSLAPIDFSDAARSRADMIASSADSPKARQMMLDFVDNRKKELKGDLRTAVNTLGESPSPFSVLEKVRERARETGQKIINPIVEKAEPANITNIVKDIDVELEKAKRSGLPLSDYQRKLYEIKDQLRGDLPNQTLMFGDVAGEQGLHRIQSALREEADTLRNSSSGADRLLGGKLQQWRNRLVDSIDESAPGYKEGLSQYKTDMQVREAFDKGLNISQKPGKTGESIAEHSGESWENWAKHAHPDEVATARLGAMSWMVHELEGVRSGKKLMEGPKDEILQQKVKALFGKERANEYLHMLEDANNKAKSAQIGNNSLTHQRRKEEEMSPVRIPGTGGATAASLQALLPAIMGGVIEASHVAQPGLAGALGVAGAAGRMGYSGLKHFYEHSRYKSDLARRAEEARRITTPMNQQPDLIQHLRAVRSNPKLNSPINKLAALPLLQLIGAGGPAISENYRYK